MIVKLFHSINKVKYTNGVTSKIESSFNKLQLPHKMKIMKNSIIFFLLTFCFHVSAQKIFLDKYQEVAGLKVYQTVNNPNKYYYQSDNIQIGRDENGKQQVLFLKYSQKDASGALAEDKTEGKGGGIFHALVNFETPAAQVKAAEKALQKQNPKATIEGPINYKSGKVALISAIAGTGKTKILGLSNAPTMQGNKTAVAFRLNKEDAILLWETFKTPVPDISFAFEMEMEGFLSPRRGYIKGNFDKVYSSHELGVSGSLPVKGIMLGADIGAAFEKMRNDGTIEVYQEEGGEDFDEFLKIAYKQLADMIFQPTDALANNKEGQDPLEQLIKHQKLLKGVSNSNGNAESNDTASKSSDGQNSSEKENSSDEDSSSKTDESTEADKGSETENDSKVDSSTEADKGSEAKNASDTKNSSDSNNSSEANNSSSTKNKKGKSAGPMPSIMATYKYRSVKQTGDFEINFNKVSAAQQFTSFAENIGQINCASCFREINLDAVHKAFDQREILYMIDGLSEDDFTSYINFVDVVFRKKHQSGTVEMDNKRIIRQTFSKKGNLFKMTYGYDQDVDAEKWESYEYKTTWSFAGGQEVVEDWQSSTAGSVNLDPPFVKGVVTFDSDKEILDELGVRAIVIRLYDMGGKSKPKQLVLRKEHSGQIEYFLPKDSNEYEYEITWMLDDEHGTVLESGRKTSAQPLMYVDRLPQKQ